mmetsp:Transcript_41697/g.101765  ORF Transcript_41697/g.101765 Transcript_41697/m.101765 type:complete len:207 (+) Transcript_41697:85-705(+)
MSNKNFSQKHIFLILVEEKINKKYTYRSYFPLMGNKKEIILILKNKKAGKISKLFKNFSFDSFLKIYKIIKLSNLKKNMKKFIGIITEGIGPPVIWSFLEFFSKINMRTQIRFIFGNTFQENFPFLKELKNFELNFPNIKIFYRLENYFAPFDFEDKIINQQQIQKFIGEPDIGKTILVNGPLKMNLKVFKILHLLGFSKESIIRF